LRASWGAGELDVVMLYVGRLAAEKNLDLLAEAYRIACSRDARVRLVVVGDGPMAEALKTRCPEAVLAGRRVGDDLAMHYASADLFVFPSLTETFGNVTVEAMASGLPVVAFDHAAAGQVICPDVQGRLAACGDRRGFVEHVLGMVADDAARARQGLAARERALSLDWPEVITQFEGVLHTAMQASRPTGQPAVRPMHNAPLRSPV
jgi:glycosyltransferase involved in cell wall biosynthesis